MERLVVVGGGILGTMHAVEARRLGIQVVHLERDAEPRSATVRNFGLVWVSGRAVGEETEVALRARSRWEEIATPGPARPARAAVGRTWLHLAAGDDGDADHRGWGD